MYPFFTDEIAGLSAQTANWIVTGVLALLALFILYMIIRLITRPRLASGRRSKHARLAITDAAAIDDRRKLVLVRRDDVEHLVMIGGATDMVIESDIRKNATARPLAPAATPAPVAPRAPTPSAPPPAAAPAAAPAAVSVRARPASPQTPPAQPGATATTKPAVSASDKKSTVTDEMDTLLNEITRDK